MVVVVVTERHLVIDKRIYEVVVTGGVDEQW